MDCIRWIHAGATAATRPSHVCPPGDRERQSAPWTGHTTGPSSTPFLLGRPYVLYHNQMETELNMNMKPKPLQEVADVAEGVSELERRLAALRMFQPGGAAGASLALVQRALPLEPALARMWCVGDKLAACFTVVAVVVPRFHTTPMTLATMSPAFLAAVVAHAIVQVSSYSTVIDSHVVL